MKTSERQTEINRHNSKKRLACLISANFSAEDYCITFVCGGNNQEKQAIKNISNTFRRIKRLYARAGKTPRYIWIMKYDKICGVYFRILITKEIEAIELKTAFKNGNITIEHFGNNIHGFVLLEFNDKPITYRRWSCSKNLKPLLPTE